MRKEIKKISIILLCAVTASCFFTGCGKKAQPVAEDETAAVQTETTAESTAAEEITEEEPAEDATEAAASLRSKNRPATVKGKSISALSREELYNVYKNILNTYVPVPEAEEYGETENIMCLGYALYDMDKDGVYELFVDKGTCEADRNWIVYKLKHNSSTDIISAEKIGECDSSHSALYVPSDGNSVLSYGGHMGWSWVYRMTLSDGSFSAEKICENKQGESKEEIALAERGICDSESESYGQYTLLKKIILDGDSSAVTHKEEFSGIF